MGKKTVSEYVLDLHEKSRLSANEFAKQHKMSHTQLAKYESKIYDKEGMSLVVISRFCDRFDMSLEEFREKILIENPALDTAISYQSTTENILFSLDKKAKSKRILEFYEQNKKSYGFTKVSESKQIADDLNPLFIDKIIEKGKNCKIAVCYFPYKKVTKESKTSNIYTQINNSILYINGTPLEKLKFTHFLFVTPSYETFEYFSNRNYDIASNKGKQHINKNLTFLYYKYKRDIKYKIILGNDFLSK